MVRSASSVCGRACVTLLVVLVAAMATMAQCDWRAEYAAYRVRTVSFAVFGGMPRALKEQLAHRRGELYTSEKPNEYVREVIKFLDTDPNQLKYEQQVASKLKFAFKGFQYESCVEEVAPTECVHEFKDIAGPPVTQCMDVAVHRRGIAIDSLNTTPYLVLFPRSTLVKLLGNLPRSLVALNPALGFDFDKVFGPSTMIDASADLLAWHGSRSSAQAIPPESTPAVPLATGLPPAAAANDNLSISVPGPNRAAQPATAERAPDGPSLDRDTKLLLTVKAEKSLDKSFYNSATGLAFSRARPLSRIQNLTLEANFLANNNPQGEGVFLQNSLSAGGTAEVRAKIGPFRLFNVGARYRWSSNRFFSHTTASELNSENAVEARTVADGSFKKGLLRVSGWFESGWPNARPNNYRRAAFLAGYGKEIGISRRRDFHKIALPDQSQCYSPYSEVPKANEPTVGLEILAGAGRARGDVPEYARFYGGNSATNFLYDEPASQNLAAFPAGPLLRSARRQAAGITTLSGALLGGTSYWHVNTNVSLPVGRWSQPLIPGEFVDPGPPEGNEIAKIPPGELVCRDLKYQIKRQVRQTGKQLLLARLAHDSLSPAEQDALRLNPRDPTLSAAQQQAASQATASYLAAKNRLAGQVEATIENEIAPITDFIADHADIYSIKPLLMAEAARIDGPDAVESRTRFGFGAGLQINVVTARFEAGYLFTAHRRPGESHGNFMVRLVFRRFF